MIKQIKAKILKHWPTLQRIKELEAKLKEERVYKDSVWSNTLKYKGEEYITIWSSDSRVKAERNRQIKNAELKLNEQSGNIRELETSLFDKNQEIRNLTEALDKLTKEVMTTLEAKKVIQEELNQALEREKELRKDLIETMKLNNALNSRTVETKTVASEPINIKPIKKKKS